MFQLRRGKLPKWLWRKHIRDMFDVYQLLDRSLQTRLRIPLCRELYNLWLLFRYPIFEWLLRNKCWQLPKVPNV